MAPLANCAALGIRLSRDERKDSFCRSGVCELLQPNGHTILSNEALIQLLLYGDKDLPNDLNSNIIGLTFQYIYTNWSI